MKNSSIIRSVVAVAFFVMATPSHGRGFGGFHGGGGGFGGGGFGGFHGGGGFDRGGFGGGGGFDRGGFGGGGGFDRGGFGGGFRGYGSGLNGGGVGGGAFDRYGGGMGRGGFRQDGGSFAGGGEAGLRSFDSGLNSLRGNASGEGFRSGGDFGGATGRFAESGRNLSDSQLNSFLGLPTDMGLHSAGNVSRSFEGSARGISSANVAATGKVDARGTVVQGPNGTTIAHGSASARGAIAGNAVTRNWSSADLRVQGNYLRNNFNHYNVFNSAWFHDHPHAWWGGAYATSPWAPCAWAALNTWFGEQWAPASYDYGDNVTYSNNSVYLNDQPIATADQYYQSAAALAQIGEQANVPTQQPSGNQVDATNPKWLPLGVFEALREKEKSSTMMFQLATNKAGIVRGNYFNTADSIQQPVEGAVDKKTQRITWVVEDRDKIIFDTGLYNLTKDETPVLVHFGKDKTEQWVFVRLNQKSNGSGQQ
jgi:hypothetical protein